MKILLGATVVSIISTQSVAWAQPSLERIAEIQKIAQSLSRDQLTEGVQVIWDENSNQVAVARKAESGYTITINPKIFRTFSQSAQDLVGFHELGHVRLGHCDMDPAKKIRSEVEFEADYFAAFLYKRFSSVDSDLLTFIDMIESNVGTTPSGPERAEIFRSVLLK